MPFKFQVIHFINKSYHQPRGMLSYYNLDEPFVKIYTYTKGLLLLIIVSNQIFLNKTKERR